MARSRPILSPRCKVTGRTVPDNAAARRRRIAFSFVGGQHQFLHGAPVAAELSNRPGVTVEAYVLDAAEAAVLRDLLARLGGQAVEIIELRLPRAVEWLGGLTMRHGESAPLKVLRLLWWSRRLRSADLIVTLERTSTLLKRLPGHCPPIAHIPHGVGGARRAGGKGIDGRFALFDKALLAGEADRETTIALGLLPAEKVAVVGQVKLAGLKRMGLLARRPLFDTALPTVLYNPHFHSRRGSWQAFGPEILQRIHDCGHFNLIVAPHVRLFESAPPQERAQWAGLSDGARLIVDPGSERSIDMTYTLAADIYLGEFSSQLYEFLIAPRPAVFIDVLGDGGQDDTNLPAMWATGETVRGVEDVVPALLRARDRHAEFVDRQRALTRRAFGDLESDAAELAADVLLGML